MQIYERINQILKNKGLKKKDFLNRFLSLNPTLKSSGESPSIPSIYNYLSGNREIKAELIPFIAKALEVSEQELFLDDDNSTDLLKELLNKQSQSSALNRKNQLNHDLGLATTHRPCRIKFPARYLLAHRFFPFRSLRPRELFARF